MRERRERDVRETRERDARERERRERETRERRERETMRVAVDRENGTAASVGGGSEQQVLIRTAGLSTTQHATRTDRVVSVLSNTT